MDRSPTKPEFSRFLKCNDFIGSKLERIILAIFLGGGGEEK